MRDSTLSLKNKYRPQNLDEFFGNETTVISLESILQREQGEERCFLFTGPSGCGKTTLARIVASTLECAESDFFEFNASNTRGIDTIREIAQNCNYKPWSGKIKAYLLDECHMLTPEAQNAVLKLLEDTPSHVRFMLCTTDPNKLLETIRKRCAIFRVAPLSKPKIIKLLSYVCAEEKVSIDEKVINKIADCSDGSPRQALILLDQVIDIVDQDTAYQAVIDVTIDDQSVLDLCRSLAEGRKWPTISAILKGINEDPERVRYAILSYFSKVLLDKPSIRIADTINIFCESLMHSGKAGLILNCYIASNIK